MRKGYSVLIFPWDGMRVRRIPLSDLTVRCLALAGAVVLGVNVYLFGAYLWLKLERVATERMKAEAEQQRAQLAKLYHQTGDMQQLLANWKTLKGRVSASVPSHRSARATNDNAVAKLEDRLTSLHKELEQLVAAIPADWPVNGRISSGVGLRFSPWTGEREFHSGLDIPNPLGTPIRAPADGVVKIVGKDKASGRVLVLDHGDGIDTRYAHLSKIHVEQGGMVRKGQRIADVGSTGRSTGPHLHYEVRVDGVPIDPRRHLLKSP